MQQLDLFRTQDQLEWLKTKLDLDSKAAIAKNKSVQRGNVYWCCLGTGVGSEEEKSRPCVVLQHDKANKFSPNTIVAPITHSLYRSFTVVPIPNKMDASGKVILDGNVLLGHIRCVSKARLGKFITYLNSTEMKEVDKAIANSIDIAKHYEHLKREYQDKLDYIAKLQNKVSDLRNQLKEKSDELVVKTKELESVKMQGVDSKE